MTIIEAINKVDALKPNTYTQSEKVAWLSDIDGLVKRTVIDTHEDGVSWSEYNDNTPLDTELLIYAPYTDSYISWLEAKIDYYNGEYNKYNNGIIRFNDMFTAYSNDYNRTHTPIGKKIKFT